MHWLEKWRLKHGVSRKQLAERCGPVTEAVIARIEEGWGYGLTCEGMAKAICDCVGATAKQYDSIVPKRCRGAYTPQKRGKLDGFKSVQVKADKPKEPYKPKNISLRGGNRRKEVLQIGLDGEIMKRYPSIFKAAEAIDKGVGFVTRRASHKVAFNEFQPMGFTFRYASAWNETAKELLMQEAQEAEKMRSQGRKSIQGRWLTIDGETHCIKEWAAMVGMDPSTLKNRLDKMGMNPKEAVFTPLIKKYKKRKKDDIED